MHVCLYIYICVTTILYHKHITRQMKLYPNHTSDTSDDPCLVNGSLEWRHIRVYMCIYIHIYTPISIDHGTYIMCRKVFSHTSIYSVKNL